MVTTEGQRQKKEERTEQQSRDHRWRQMDKGHKDTKAERSRDGETEDQRTGSRKDVETLDAYTEMEERNKKTRKMRGKKRQDWVRGSVMEP